MTLTFGRRSLGALLAAAAAARGRPSHAADTPGVTATELRIGNTMPYSGPASSYGVIGKLEAAFFNMVNQQGGVGGRKINFISLDDGYSPPKTVEQVRRLVEVDQVAFLFNMLGTPTNSAVHRYVNQKKVPHLFVSTGADKWSDYKHFPWTMGFQPSYRTEAQIYAKYVLQRKPDARIAILYQNDDFGKDYPAGLRDVLGANYDRQVVSLTYETTDPTVDSQITSLRSSGADALIVAAIPKFAAQSIRKLADIGWKPPIFMMSNVAISVGTVINPAGPDNARDMLSTNYIKDPTDPRWNNDPGMQEWRDFMARHMPGADLADLSYVYGYSVSRTMLHVLQQCNGDFSRPNIMKQAAGIKDLELPTVLPGIRLNTSPTNYRPIRAMQMMKWDGRTWVPFGDVIEGVSTDS